MNRIAQAALAPLSWPYQAALYLREHASARGLTHPRQLAWPVVSIGNLSLGGAGKTPLTIALVRLLQSRGIAVDVLSRGYGRTSTAIERVQLSPALDDPAARFGDEPLLIAAHTGAPVYVGAERHRAGLLAESELPGPRLHLLDDAFQHRRLARAFDIVVLHHTDFTARLLPAGRLREPLSALRRASAFVLRAEDAALHERLPSRIPVWIIRRRLALPPGITSGIVFSGIAHPQEFLRALAAHGIDVKADLHFRDHHRYTATDITRILALARRHQAHTVLTTEKDLVRLPRTFRQQLEAELTLAAPGLLVSFDDEAAVLSALHPLLPAP